MEERMLDDDELFALQRQELLEGDIEQTTVEIHDIALTLTTEGDELFDGGDFDGAAEKYERASLHDFSNVELHKKRWCALTHNFTQTDCFYDEDYAYEAEQASDEVRAYLLENIGERVKEERDGLQAELTPIKERFTAAQAERRTVFKANRNYHLVRTLPVLAVFVLMAIACGVSASFLTATQGFTPVVCMIAFGAVGVVALVLGLIFLRGLITAQRLYSANEQYSSTEDGKKVLEYEQTIALLNGVLGES